MMEKMKLKTFLISLLLVSGAGHADSSVEDLSPELRGLLAKEMAALQEGMQSLIPAYASGDFEAIAEIAAAMKNSYVLKQEITDSQKHELASKLPAPFLDLDQKFHEYAGMLEHVATEENAEHVGFFFYRLTESCVGCHSQFATHRFPLFEAKAVTSDHHH